MRFDRSRTAIDTAGQFSHLRVGDAVNVESITLISRNPAGASMRRFDKAHLFQLSHFAANRRAGHTKQLG